MKSRKSNIYTASCRFVAVAVVLLSVAMPLSAQQRRVAADFELGRATEILANIMREFETGYVDEVSADALLDKAALGMVNATDPYSEYLSEESMKSFEMHTTGKYAGVGSLIRKKGDYVIFAQPYKGSPASSAGEPL